MKVAAELFLLNGVIYWINGELFNWKTELFIELLTAMFSRMRVKKYKILEWCAEENSKSGITFGRDR